MKKFLSVFIILVLVVGLTACGGNNTDATTASTNVVGTQVDVSNNGGMAITFDEDNIRAILGSFTSDQLRISGDIYDYTLKLSSEVYNGVNGCRVEAIPAGGVSAEQVYFVDGVGCYVFDKASQKYVSVVADSVVDTSDTTDTSVGTTVNNPPQSDIPVDFQYHEENNKALQARFSQYDLSPIGMPKALSEYILVVTTRVAVVSGANVNVIAVHEKDGTLTEYQLALGAEQDYYFDSATQSYVALS